ncbi:MAG: Gfo/Idh/MocA family oxidoreductase [Proteobacteria bacterium]|nr:Gfo/Idh/MocA family oxidoreductase [Pseudomonadota bacterium]
MKRINVGIIGTGWCGGIRANTCANSALVDELHIAEINQQRLDEVTKQTGPKTATTDYKELLANDAIDAFMISATPEVTHFPMALDCLKAGKHVFLEKPISLTLKEADELVDLARDNNLKFTIGYSQRFNPKFAFVKKSLNDGTLGEPVSALISRHISRNLGNKISGRIKLSPAAMEATHDLDFALWCMEPAKPIRVYAQAVNKVMRPTHGVEDCMWIIVTMDDGTVLTVGAGWIMPPAYPNFSTTTIEFVGSKGALMIDDSHKDVMLTTMDGGIVHPMSTMPGEQVEHVFAGPMHAETIHFLEAVTYDRPVMVTPEQARKVMEVYMAADLSAERNEPVPLPMNARDISEAAPV